MGVIDPLLPVTNDRFAAAKYVPCKLSLTSGVARTRIAKC
jgi:hypothetical protein